MYIGGDLKKEFDAERADEIFYNAGKLAGEHFYRNVQGESTDFSSFIKHLQESLKEMGVGILALYSAKNAGRNRVRVAEKVQAA